MIFSSELKFFMNGRLQTSRLDQTELTDNRKKTNPSECEQELYSDSEIGQV